MIKKLHNALFTDDDTLFFGKGSGNATFSNDEMRIFIVDRNDIRIGYANFHGNDPETVIHVRLTAWCNRLKQRI